MKSTALFSIILFLLTSCAQSTDSENSKTEKSLSEKETPTTAAESEAEELSLNNGEKWQVNPEMMVHINASESLLQNSEPASDQDYADLAADLKENKNQLIYACTMKGPSHDALHLWLLPYIGRIDDLAEAESENDKKKAVTELRQSFDTFRTYFE